MVDANRSLTILTRIGFAARGLLYLVIASLVLTTGRAEDPAGALDYLGRGGGQILMVLMTLGLLAYGLWRFSDAMFDIERHGTDRSAIFERLGAAASGVVHLILAFQAMKLMQGISSRAENSSQDAAQSVLQFPGGSTLLLIGGLILFAVGIFQFAKAARLSFLKHLDSQISRQTWVKWTGRLGYAARGIVFLITSVFLLKAGQDEQASEAGGMAEALSWLNSPWDLIVAAGLLAFGMFSLIEARFRILHDVPVDGLAQRVRAKL